MAKKTTIKKRKTSKIHVHIHEIPLRYFPRTRGNQSKKHQAEIMRMLSSIRYTNEQVQYTGQICQFNVRSIPTKSGFNPSFSEVFRLMQEFVYHYENYCYRVFAFREKLSLFINEILELGYVGRDIAIKNLKIHPMVKAAKLNSLIGKFYDKRLLGKVIDERHKLTHKLYFGKTFDHFLRPTFDYKTEAEFKKWCAGWKGEVASRSELTNKATYTTMTMGHEVATRIVDYKNSLKDKAK